MKIVPTSGPCTFIFYRITQPSSTEISFNATGLVNKHGNSQPGQNTGYVYRLLVKIMQGCALCSTSSRHLYDACSNYINCMEGVFAVYPNNIIYGMCISTSILSMEIVSVYHFYIIYGRCISVSYLYYLWNVYPCIITILSKEGVSVYLYYLWKVYQCIYINPHILETWTYLYI